MDIIPLRSLARKALAHLSNNCWISALSFAEVRAFGIHTSKTHASVSTENAMNFFIVGAPFNSHDTRELIQTAVTMHGGATETGSIIWWRVQRSQAKCIKFVG